jgi:phospholipid/cholesterol/gamma-HCH transport system substrate-binding protein
MKDIGPAAKVLRENTPEFTKLLDKLAEFSGTANDVVGKTRAQVLQLVEQVSPVLDEFLNVKNDLGPSFDDLVHLSKLFNAAVPGDYANMYLTLELDKLTLPNLLGPGGGGSTGLPGGLLGGLLGGAAPSTKPPTTTSNGLGGLGGLLSGILGGAK